jgi:hypothetical protein
MGDGLAMKLTADKQRGYADSIRALIKEYDIAPRVEIDNEWDED